MYYSLRDANGTIVDHGKDTDYLIWHNYDPESDKQLSLYQQEQLNPSSLVKLCDLEKVLVPQNDNIPTYDKTVLWFGVFNNSAKFWIKINNICCIDFGDGYKTILSQGEHFVHHQYKRSYKMHHVQISFGVEEFKMGNQWICYFRLSQDSTLKKLHMEHVNMHSINLVGRALEECAFNACELESISVDCMALKTLSVYNNKLKNIDIIDAPKLLDLDCSWNQITSLSLFKCSDLRILKCNNNKFSKHVIFACSKLQKLNCGGNLIESLTIHRCRDLERLDCSANWLTKLNLCGLDKLKYLCCSENQISELTISGVFLEELYTRHNKLTKLKLNELSFLKNLDCAFNELEELDLRNCASLKELNCSVNKIVDIQLGSKRLKSANLFKNKIRELVLSKHLESLEYLNCENNNLSRLDLSQCSNLDIVDARSNPIEEIIGQNKLKVYINY